MKVLLCQKTPTRDGVTLATDVYLPGGRGPWPAILARTPYHRVTLDYLGPFFTGHGFAFAVQDCRGKYDSEGVYVPLEDEERDGQDAVSWTAEQSWCNGRIGMSGLSYAGIVQIPAASGGHEALKCIVAGVAPNTFFTDWIRYDGCFALANLTRWPFTHSVCPTKPSAAHVIWKEIWKLGARGTVADVEEALGCPLPILRRWLRHDSYDAYWEKLDQRRMYKNLRCAGLHLATYFDHVSRGQFQAYRGLSQEGATGFARRNQDLIVGPWGHGGYTSTDIGDLCFGSDASLDWQAYQLRFLNLWLKNLDDGVSEEPPVKYFLMGSNRWAFSETWPPPESKFRKMYLSSSGAAIGPGGGGGLTEEPETVDDADSFSYDPLDPAPTQGGQIYWGVKPDHGVGPVDQRSILKRTDVLYYRGVPLREPMTVVGPVTLDLWIASSARDTDFVAKFCVVEHSGRIIALTIGSLRCRYRDSWAEPIPLQPGEAVKLRIQMNNTAYTFPRGSRVALIITSSCFPRILPSPNTFSPTWAESNPVRAQQEVLHCRGYESHLGFYVIDGG